MKKQLAIIAVAALVVSVSLLYSVQPSMGVASGVSSKNVTANASHGVASDQKNPLPASVGNMSPSAIQTAALGVSAASSAPPNAVTAATTATTIILSASTTIPTVNQPVTFTATLTSGTAPLSSESVTIYHYLNGVRYNDTTATTNANGQITLTQSFGSAGQRTYYATFTGDSSHHTSTSSVVTVNVNAIAKSQTSVTLTASTTTPTVNQPVTFTATLTSGTTPLSSESVTIYHYLNGVRYNDTTATTNANGQITLTQSFGSAGQRTYYAYFAGDTTHTSATSAAVTVTVGSLQESVISIFASNYTPAVNQPYTIYGVLQNGVTGAFLAGQPVEVTIQSPSGAEVTLSTTTAANGSYTVTHSESAPGSYVCSVSFSNASSGYTASGSMIDVSVGNLVPTILSLNITKTNPGVGQSFTISGYLTDTNGKPLSGMGLYTDARLPTGAWAAMGTTTTDANGRYSITYNEQNPGQYYYEVIFWGDNTYTSVTTVVWVSVGNLTPTTVTIAANNNNPAVGQSFTLSGKLTDTKGNPLTGKEIDLYDPADSGGIAGTRYTDQSGSYSFVVNESSSGYYLYTVEFMGDQTYAYTLASVTVTAGTLTPTTLTTTTSNANPAANQQFVLSGYLKDNATGTPISGATITLFRADPSGTWTTPATTTTAANGSFTLTRSESQAGAYWYYANFAGDSTHSSTSSYGVGVTVG